METADLQVTKLGAADRNLNSAIRQFFMEEDPLAIHLVASAAYNVFSDLLKQRGKEEAFWPLAYGLLRAVRDIADGSLRKEEVDRDWPDGSWEHLDQLVQKYRRTPFDIDSAQVSGPPEQVREFWKEFRKHYNFLKHANRDEHGLLPENLLDNENLIMRSMGAAAHLNCPVSSEKTFLYAYLICRGKLIKDKRLPEGSLLAAIFEQLTKDQIFTLARRNLCYPRVSDSQVDEIDMAEAMAFLGLRKV